MVQQIFLYSRILHIVLLQDKTLQEFADEIRKLKAMIVKHENRIRALEAEVALSKSTTAATDDDDGAGGGDGLQQSQELAADEV